MKDRAARKSKRIGNRKLNPSFFKRKDLQEWWARVSKNPNFQKVLEAAYSKRKFKRDLYEHAHQQSKADNYNEGFSDMAAILEELATFKPSKQTKQRDGWEHAVDPDLNDALNDEDTEIN